MTTRFRPPSLRWAATVVLLYAFAVASTQAADVDLQKVRQQFDSYLARLDTALQEQRSRWDVGYARGLQMLEKKLQSEGKLDELIAVKEELTRFKESRAVLPETPGDAPDELRKLQDHFRQNRSTFELEHNRKVLKLAEQYDERLSGQQKKLTMAGKIEEALSIRAERRRAEEDATVTAARFELASLEDSGFDGGGTPGDDFGGDGTLPQKASTPVPEHGVKIHSGRAPSISGLTFKRILLYRTEHSSLAGGLAVSAQAAVKDHTVRSPGSSSRSSRKEDGWHLRLSLRASREDVKDVQVSVQFYTKNAAPQGRIAPQLYSSKRLALPLIGASPVTLDYPPVETQMSRSKARATGWTIRGQEMHGVIVSVFNSDDKLIYQEVSERGLGEIASATLPDETDEGPLGGSDSIEGLRRAMLEAELQYREVLATFQAAGREADEALKSQLRQKYENVKEAQRQLKALQQQKKKKKKRQQREF